MITIKIIKMCNNNRNNKKDDNNNNKQDMAGWDGGLYCPNTKSKEYWYIATFSSMLCQLLLIFANFCQFLGRILAIYLGTQTAILHFIKLLVAIMSTS